LFGAVIVSGAFPVTAIAGQMSQMTVASLLRLANGSDPAARLSATQERFRRGPAIRPQLERAGSKPISTVSPARGDVIYTLLGGRLSTENAAPKSFGLHVDANLTASGVQKIGRAHGFRLDPGSQCRPDLSPICYVDLLPGKNLAAVLREILMTESHVSTVNLNYVLR
jgi:hypothetical protein